MPLQRAAALRYNSSVESAPFIGCLFRGSDVVHAVWRMGKGYYSLVTLFPEQQTLGKLRTHLTIEMSRSVFPFGIGDFHE